MMTYRILYLDMSSGVTSHPPDGQLANTPLQATNVRQGPEEELQGREAQLAVGDALPHL